MHIFVEKKNKIGSLVSETGSQRVNMVVRDWSVALVRVSIDCLKRGSFGCDWYTFSIPALQIFVLCLACGFFFICLLMLGTETMRTFVWNHLEANPFAVLFGSLITLPVHLWLSNLSYGFDVNCVLLFFC